MHNITYTSFQRFSMSTSSAQGTLQKLVTTSATAAKANVNPPHHVSPSTMYTTPVTMSEPTSKRYNPRLMRSDTTEKNTCRRRYEMETVNTIKNDVFLCCKSQREILPTTCLLQWCTRHQSQFQYQRQTGKI